MILTKEHILTIMYRLPTASQVTASYLSERFGDTMESVIESLRELDAAGFVDQISNTSGTYYKLSALGFSQAAYIMSKGELKRL